MSPALEKTVKVWHLILAATLCALTLGTAVYGAGAKMNERDRAIIDHEGRISKVEEAASKTSYNVIVIGEKLGLGSRLQR